MTRPQQLLFLELNEINFEYIERYIAMGKLPEFKRFFSKHGFEETESEQAYDHLEPWIQWVTAHTGLTYGEHGVFRLGDIAQTELLQIWEELEDAGLKVGAVSPMNAKFRLRDPAFFIPDPWTDTEARASGVDRRLYQAIRQTVNDNASGRLTKKSMVDFVVGGVRSASPHNYLAYAKMLNSARNDAWAKALFLDQVLADLFARLVREKSPDFASLFLNAGAHIQHHYMFNSMVYSGPYHNPDWYVAADRDPVLEVYELYDRVLCQIQRSFPDARVMIATGLHQEPYGSTAFYWRLIDHGSFLNQIGVAYQSVEPRMSRDFLIRCGSDEKAMDAERRLNAAQAPEGTKMFTVDNRGHDLFVILSYPNDIPEDMTVIVGNEQIPEFRKHVAFVAIKNGEHDGIGYFSDSGLNSAGRKRFPLTQVPERIRSALDIASLSLSAA